MLEGFIGEMPDIDGAPYDAFVCLNFLEHVPQPGEVLRILHANTTDDAVAAKAAGVVPIGVRTGGVPDEALYAAGCARIYDDLSGLIDLIDGLAVNEEARCAG